jgi:thymidylate synthase ThyX
MSGGRGFSHEQVRHRFNVSQRSSRFCDEADSPIIEHPLISEYLGDPNVSVDIVKTFRETRASQADGARQLYRVGVNVLQNWLVNRGVDKGTARKQARGAMRNDLGNGLMTEIIFTASINAWKHMFTMRSSQFADAEIREVYCRLLPEFQAAGLFTDWKMVPSPDGLGHCVVM